MQIIELAFQVPTTRFPIVSFLQTRCYRFGLWFNFDWTEDTLGVEEQAANPLRKGNQTVITYSSSALISRQYLLSFGHATS